MTVPRPITSQGQQAWLGSSANHMAAWAGPRQHSEHFRALHVSSGAGCEDAQREPTARRGERGRPAPP